MPKKMCEGAWNSMSTQRKVAAELDTQSKVSDDLLLSYREQFNVGRRSLLDVLDAQNTRYNVQVRLETAKFAEQFAEYQVLGGNQQIAGVDEPEAGVRIGRLCTQPLRLWPAAACGTAAETLSALTRIASRPNSGEFVYEAFEN